MAQFAQVMAEVGDFGRFQVRLTILMGIPNFLAAFFIFGQVFMVLDEAHHCSVSWVKNHTFNLSAAEQLAISIPNDTAGRPESCLMFRPPCLPTMMDCVLKLGARIKPTSFSGSLCGICPNKETRTKHT